MQAIAVARAWSMRSWPRIPSVGREVRLAEPAVSCLDSGPACFLPVNSRNGQASGLCRARRGIDRFLVPAGWGLPAGHSCFGHSKRRQPERDERQYAPALGSLTALSL
ncbi:hypothetical protein Fraau_0398 [Frateuria aurantia DSM 6220]|uniref:Uncharacterized protein n=1 Tax=Frateuria aurantia (strain ATCC 33424 / DSM 6220 / KCTC 2777 / LMG 1558 / NBRC 3245 / NCIMB 13370) TaxID=767434 RepID=H8L3T2_FRAAD|nr:hypothetical protein Fraau_0398 [Frateuria aurantia DSM 6220]